MIQGIILAAGLSTRMGRPKLWIEIDRIPLLARVLQATLDSRLDSIILVTGPGSPCRSDSISDRTSPERIRIVVNRNPVEGMASSVRMGMSEIDPRAQGVMIILADQPWLTSKIINELAEAFAKDPHKIVAPAVHGRRTTPVVFPSDLFPDLIRQTGDVGGRGVLNQNPERVVQIEMGSYYDDADIDTPEDLTRNRKG
jgi:molybdenum cofactor cytidylyltransferase